MPNESLWSWLFDSLPSNVQGFTDANTKEHITFKDVKEYTAHLSTALTHHGLREGDVVVIYGRNSIWYPVAALSALRVGAIACGVSPAYNVEELTFSLGVSKAKFILTTPEVAETATAAAANTGLSKDNVFLMEGNGMTSIQSLIQEGKTLKQTKPYEIPQGKSNTDVCGYLCFSSGTTGLPKAVMISHANVIAQCLQTQYITPADHDKILAALPFYHITGIVHQLHVPISRNAHVYVLPSFTLDSMLKTVVDYKIKELLLVPPILIRLVRETVTHDLSHVTRFSSGAAPLSPEILVLLERKYPGTGFKQGYGMTESCSVLTAHPTSKSAYKYGHKVGMLVGSTEARIVDPDTGKDCAVGQSGEIWARGPQITMGYLDNPKATEETFKDGFLHTGDIGAFDEEGMLTITDRMKEMIKVKGISVAPAELENLLLGHPAVSDVAVCGIADQRAGERPKAYVVLKPHQQEDGHGLIEFVKSKKARHKWIAEVEFVGEIPKSPAGKILRRKLQSSGRVYRDQLAKL